MATATFLFSEITIFHLVIVLVGCAIYLHIDKITRGICLFCMNVCKMKKILLYWYYIIPAILSLTVYWEFTQAI